MSEQTLQILTQVSYPNVRECFNLRSSRPSALCPYPGFFIEVISLITSRLGVTAQFVGLNDPILDVYRSGDPKTNITIDLVLDLLKNGTFDLMTIYFDNSGSYGEGFEYSAPIYLSQTKYVVGRAQSLTGIFSFFAVYDAYLWLGILGTFVLFSLIAFLIYYCVPKVVVKNQRSIGNLTWQLFRLEILQYDSIQERILSLNALIMFFALFNCGFLVRMYTGLITTQAVRHIDPRPFKSNEIFKVLKEGRYSFIFHSKYYWWYQDIMNSSKTPFFDLRQAIKNNPIRLATDEAPGVWDSNAYILDQVQKGGWITIQTNEGVEISKHGGFCNFVTFETNFPTKTKHLMMRKRHPLLPAINRVIEEEAITIKRLHEKYYKHARPLKCEERRKKVRPLGLHPYVGILILLLAGFGLSVCAFFVELILKRRKSK